MVLFYTKSVTVKLLPFDNKSEIAVVVDLPEGASLEDTERTLFAAADIARGLPEATSVQSYAGTPAPFNFNGLVRHYYLRERPEQGELQVNLTARGERKRASHAIALDLRERLKAVAVPAGTSVKVVEVPPGPPVLSTLLAEIYGPDAATRRAVTAEIKKLFADVPFIVDIDDSIGEKRPRLRLSIDQDRLEFFGVEQKDVYDTIQTLFGGVSVGYSHRGEDRNPIEIAVRLPKRDLAWSEALASTPVPANTLPGSKTVVELGQVVKAVREEGSATIFRRDGRFADMVMAELAGRFEAPLYGMMEVDKRIEAHDWGKLPKPAISMHGQPSDEIAPDAAVGRRVGDHLGHLPRHGGGVRRGDPRHLRAGGGAVQKFPAAAGGADADSADADRHLDRALAAGRGVHRHLDDRLHRARRHHRAQLDPADRLHPPLRRRGKDAARNRARRRRDPLQADPADRAGRDDRRGDDPARSDLPGPGDLAAVRAGVLDAAHRAGDPGDLHRATRGARGSVGR